MARDFPSGAGRVVSEEVVVHGGGQAVREVLRRVRNGAAMAGLDESQREKAETALAEVLNNIVEHAFDNHDGSIRLHLERTGSQLVLTVDDDGRPMPGGRLPDAVLPGAGDLAEGGYGWPLIRCLSSHLCYERHNGTNRLSMVFALKQSSG